MSVLLRGQLLHRHGDYHLVLVLGSLEPVQLVEFATVQMTSSVAL